MAAFSAAFTAILAGFAVELAAWFSVRDVDLAAAADITLDHARGVVNAVFWVLLGVSVAGAAIWLGLLLHVLLLRAHRRCLLARSTATVLAVLWALMLALFWVVLHTRVAIGNSTAIAAVVNELALALTVILLCAPTTRRRVVPDSTPLSPAHRDVGQRRQAPGVLDVAQPARLP